MPKITTFNFLVDNTRVKIPIYYSTKTKEFTIDLPVQYEKIIGIASVSSNSEDGLISKLMICQKEYKKALTTTEKIILVKVGANISMKIEDAWFNKKTISFAQGAALEISAGVYLKRTIADRRTYEFVPSKISSEYSPGRIAYTQNEVELDWTQDTEDYLAELFSRFENLIYNVYQLLKSKESIEILVNIIKNY